MEFKERIRQLRIEKGISGTSLAAQFDKTDTAIRMWETGRSKPDADTLIRLAHFFDCSLDYLLGISPHKNDEKKMNYEQRADKLKFLAQTLPDNFSEMYQDIEQEILECYHFLANDDEELAKKAFYTICRFIKTIHFQCEVAFTIFGSGYDSFDLDEIPLIENEIKEKVMSDVECLHREISDFFRVLSNRMTESLPEHAEPENSYIDLLKQKIESAKEGVTNAEKTNP